VCCVCVVVVRVGFAVLRVCVCLWWGSGVVPCWRVVQRTRCVCLGSHCHPPPACQPRDVVSLAATNHAMYSRVDALFSPRRQQHRQSTGSPRSLALGISGGVPPGGGGAAGAGAGVGPHASGVSGSGAPSGSLGRAGLGRAGLGRAGGGTRGGNSGSMNNNRSPRQPGHPSEQIPDHPSGSSSSGGRGRGAEQGTASRRGSRLSLSMGRSGKNSSRKPLQMKDVLAALESVRCSECGLHMRGDSRQQFFVETWAVYTFVSVLMLVIVACALCACARRPLGCVYRSRRTSNNSWPSMPTTKTRSSAWLPQYVCGAFW